ncbi:hypothetical protein BH11BAC2_BH11BAC2_22040 [soil metagenome]
MNKDKAVLSLLLLVSIHICEGQSLIKKFSQLSRPEKTWTVFHLFKAKKAWNITTQARIETQAVLKDSVLDQFPNGGQVDAFRHAYWMALETKGVGPKRAEKLGKAHEKGNYRDFKKGRLEEGALPDSLSGVMDLYNNHQGILIAQLNPSASEERLKELIISAIKGGAMRIIKRNNKGIRVTCDDEIIVHTDTKRYWYLPFCLIRSDNSP